LLLTHLLLACSLFTLSAFLIFASPLSHVLVVFTLSAFSFFTCPPLRVTKRVVVSGHGHVLSPRQNTPEDRLFTRFGARGLSSIPKIS